MNCAFSRKRKLGRIAPFHEAREHCLHEGRGRSELFVEAVLHEAGERVVEAVRKGQGSPTVTLRGAGTVANMREKLRRRFGARSFREGGGQEHPAVIIGAADENLAPWLRVCRREIMAVRELLDLFRSESGKNLLRQLAQERIAQAIDALEMFEEENQALEMRDLQFAVDAVKRMRHRMHDRCALQIGLELEDVLADAHDLRVLGFRDSPNEEVDLAGILREISRDLFADEGVRQVGDLQAALDCVVVGDGDEIHPLGAQARRRALSDANSCPEDRIGEKAILPNARWSANEREDRSDSLHLGSRIADLGTLLCNPIAVGGRLACLRQAIQEPRDLPPDFSVFEIRRVKAEPEQRRRST